jgi:hypothetical protein
MARVLRCASMHNELVERGGVIGKIVIDCR